MRLRREIVSHPPAFDFGQKGTHLRPGRNAKREQIRALDGKQWDRPGCREIEQHPGLPDCRWRDPGSQEPKHCAPPAIRTKPVEFAPRRRWIERGHPARKLVIQDDQRLPFGLGESEATGQCFRVL